jgi:hypothetical protein
MKDNENETKPEIRTTVRETRKTGADTDTTAPARTFAAGQEKALAEAVDRGDLSEQDVERLEQGGFIAGFSGPKEVDLETDPTIKAGARSVAVAGDDADTIEERTEKFQSARKSGRKSTRKSAKKGSREE